MIRNNVSCYWLTFFLLRFSNTAAWIAPMLFSSSSTTICHVRYVARSNNILAATITSANENVEKQSDIFIPVFDFTVPETVDKVDRLDDAIMGGISTSSVQPADGFARWGGVCRTDGGGFCGFRTNTFAEPLKVGNSDGIYVMCRLVSDSEPERRVWKLTTRSKPNRGELLYQAPFNLTWTNPEKWEVIKVPFDTFRYVRGPRMIPDGPSLNTTAGLYQIGMTMSKFVFGVNTTEIDNFRDGFFELHIKEIGLYTDQSMNIDVNATKTEEVKVLSKLESKQRRPLLLKILLPISKIFFSEQSQRRKSAMRILCQDRKLRRVGAILWGIRSRSRARKYGMIGSLAKTISILVIDLFRAIVNTMLKITFVFPLRLLRSVVQPLKKKSPKSDNEVSYQRV